MLSTTRLLSIHIGNTREICSISELMSAEIVTPGEVSSDSAGSCGSSRFDLRSFIFFFSLLFVNELTGGSDVLSLLRFCSPKTNKKPMPREIIMYDKHFTVELLWNLARVGKLLAFMVDHSHITQHG